MDQTLNSNQPPLDEIKLTDPVISNDLRSNNNTPPDPPQITTQSSNESIIEESTKDADQLRLKPANVPISPTKPTSAIIITGLILLSLIGIGLATFFFIKTSHLQEQINSNLDPNNKSNNNIQSNSTNDPKQINLPQTSPPVISSAPINPLASFDQLDKILKLAFQKDPQAQLLMITAENILLPHQLLLKYWFRSTDDLGLKTYFYLLTQPGSNIKLFDQNIYIAQDNNTPSINADANSHNLGSDLDTIHKLVQETVISKANLSSDPDTASAQFVKAKLNDSTEVNIWQITYHYLDRTTPVVVQINAQTNNVIFTNIKYNISPEEETSQSPTPTTTP